MDGFNEALPRTVKTSFLDIAMLRARLAWNSANSAFKALCYEDCGADDWFFGENRVCIIECIDSRAASIPGRKRFLPLSSLEIHCART